MSAPRSRGKKKRGEEEEHVNHERWLVSYADMVTVIMALFIVLFAISQVDQDKYESLRASLSAGFGGGAPASILPDGAGPMTENSSQMSPPMLEGVVPNLTDGLIPQGSNGEVPPLSGGKDEKEQAAIAGALEAAAESAAKVDMEAAEKEYDNLTAIRDRIYASLDKQDLSDSVKFRINKNGLVIGMITNDMFFAPGRDDLTTTSQLVIDTITPALSKLPNQISIEGHADIVPTTSQFKSNWELSSARATTVLRRMIDVGSVKPNRVAAVGYGEARPLVSGRDAVSLAANRRVDVVVLSSQPERIRELLPFVDESRNTK